MRMELPFPMPNLAEQFNALKKQNEVSSSQSAPVDTIDLEQINLDDEESWLSACPKKLDTNLRKWLYEDDSPEKCLAQPCNKTEISKYIDTRTFTRPKKRLVRPSIEKYNDELYGIDCQSDSLQEITSKKLIDSGICVNGFLQETGELTPTQPLHFDLGQTTASYYFENILAGASNIDSFQNMSPPSLVNSMCSSTFANLMENSFIKNDPILREIRDTDYTASILQQETEPMFQSFTESFSSLNSDVPENYLKKVSFSENLRRNFVKSSDTFTRADRIDDGNSSHHNDHTFPDNLNSTYRRSPKLKSTFRVADISNGAANLNSTFNKDCDSGSSESSPLNCTVTLEKSPPDLNATIILEPRGPNRSADVEPKRLLNRRERLSQEFSNSNDHLNVTYNADGDKNLQRDSLSESSTENLDYVSISSNSSKGSSKMLSVEGINAIAEMQERSLHVVSTPLPNSQVTRHLWGSLTPSPIHLADRNSDPDLSSNETAVTKTNTSTPIIKQKSLGHLNAKDPRPRTGPRRLETVASSIRSSYPNLKSTIIPNRPPQSNMVRPDAVRTNLNSMGRTLKGSYTSLRPVSANLPVAPPPLNTTTTIVKNKTQVAQVQPIPREAAAPVKLDDATFIAPKLPVRSSGLPRPVNAATGIPRPASRIPGPRGFKSVSKVVGQGKQPSY